MESPPSTGQGFLGVLELLKHFTKSIPQRRDFRYYLSKSSIKR